jgi:hypothetical protein
VRKKDENSGFQTHIAEPRWQQVLSLILVVIGFLFWVGLFFWHR